MQQLLYQASFPIACSRRASGSQKPLALPTKPVAEKKAWPSHDSKQETADGAAQEYSQVENPLVHALNFIQALRLRPSFIQRHHTYGGNDIPDFPRSPWEARIGGDLSQDNTRKSFPPSTEIKKCHPRETAEGARAGRFKRQVQSPGRPQELLQKGQQQSREAAGADSSVEMAPHSSRHPQHRENWGQPANEQMLNNRRTRATSVVFPTVLQGPFHTCITSQSYCIRQVKTFCFIAFQAK